MSPQLGILSLTIAIAAQLIAARMHVDVGEWVASLGAFGVAALVYASHNATQARLQESRSELDKLRKSITPPPEGALGPLPTIPPADAPPKDP